MPLPSEREREKERSTVCGFYNGYDAFTPKGEVRGPSLGLIGLAKSLYTCAAVRTTVYGASASVLKAFGTTGIG